VVGNGIGQALFSTLEWAIPRLRKGEEFNDGLTFCVSSREGGEKLGSVRGRTPVFFRDWYLLEGWVKRQGFIERKKRKKGS